MSQNIKQNLRFEVFEISPPSVEDRGQATDKEAGQVEPRDSRGYTAMRTPIGR